MPQLQALFSIQSIHQLLAHSPALTFQLLLNIPVAESNPDLCDFSISQLTFRTRLRRSPVPKSGERNASHPVWTYLAHLVHAPQLAHRRAAARGFSSYLPEGLQHHFLAAWLQVAKGDARAASADCLAVTFASSEQRDTRILCW
jgi:hypothetical protein